MKNRRVLRILDKSKSVKQDSDNESESDAESLTDGDKAEFITEICNKTWQIHKVSPLYGFIYKSYKLNQYGKLLTAEILAEKAKGTGVLTDVEGDIKTTFSVLNGTKDDEDDKPGIKILVSSKDKNKDIFCGILYNIKDPNHNYSFEKHDETVLTFLPVLLTRGLISVTNCVVKFIMQHFNGYSSHYEFPPNGLEWLLMLWPFSPTKPTSLDLLYKTNLEDLNFIEISIDYDTINNLWRIIHNENSVEFTLEEVQAFMEAIFKHVNEAYSLHLEMLTLNDVKTGVLSASVTGKLKIKKREEVFEILRHISVNCLDIVFPHS